MGNDQSSNSGKGFLSRKPLTVTASVNVYDLNAGTKIAAVAKATGFGLYHTGVVIQLDDKPEGEVVPPPA